MVSDQATNVLTDDGGVPYDLVHAGLQARLQGGDVAPFLPPEGAHVSAPFTAGLRARVAVLRGVGLLLGGASPNAAARGV